MSFYTYYGKIKEDLLVAILPSGTVQPGDSIYIYTKQKLSLCLAKTVSNTSDGDCFEFQDESTIYEGVSKKGYKQIDLTIKCSSGNSKSTLTRQYEQPSCGQHLTNYPKIWTGKMNFHQWAKNESFVAIAPQGLGNSKPIVSIWQWTKDEKNVPKSLSYATGVQKSTASDISKFSFTQNGYYTLSCQMDAATDGLKVTIKSPSNDEQVQQLALAAKIEPGERHKLSPPKGIQQNLPFDCSLPQEKCVLDRITTPLPFPSDLIETLKFSAAYVDQAGYMAKYAIDQFDKLNNDYHELEGRLDERAEQVTGLLATILELREENKKAKDTNAELKNANQALEKKLEDERKETERLKECHRAEVEKLHKKYDCQTIIVREQEAYIRELEKCIAEDKKRELENRRKNREHDKRDHKLIEELRRELAAEKKKVDERNGIIAGLTADIACMQGKIDKLNSELRAEKSKNCAAQKEIERLQDGMKEARTTIKILEDKLAATTKALNTAEANLKAAKCDIERKASIIRELETELACTVEALEKARCDIEVKDKTICELQGNLKRALCDLEEAQTQLEKAKTERDEAQDDLSRARIALGKANDKIERAREDYKQLHEALDSRDRTLKAAEQEVKDLTKDNEALRNQVKDLKKPTPKQLPKDILKTQPIATVTEVCVDN